MTTQSRSNRGHTATETERAPSAAKATPAAFRECDESSDLLSAAREAKNQFDSQIKEQGERLARHYLGD